MCLIYRNFKFWQTESTGIVWFFISILGAQSLHTVDKKYSVVDNLDTNIHQLDIKYIYL